MEGLPFLPGNSFKDPTKARFHRSHTLGYKNGYSTVNRPTTGIGGDTIPHDQLTEQELDELANYNPTLTYGQTKQAPPEDFIPAHVHWDKKVLKFNAWFKQTVHESPDEHERVRHVNIYYYLEDDSISVVEDHVENSGMPQGKLIKRQRLPKNDVGDHWTWRDLNRDIDVTFYGKVFYIYDCDKWTRDFLESEGIEVNTATSYPSDMYLENRKTAGALKTFKTKSDFDKLRQFLEMDRKVLRFYAAWDDRDQMFGEMRNFIIHYFLVDDTLEIREMHNANDGRDPFPVLICRQKVPKDRYNVEVTFPSIVMELSEQEIKDFFSPKDFKLGDTVQIYNRRFLIYDCDNFTKAYYWKNFGMTDFTPIDTSQKSKTLAKMEVPPYNGFGSLEDSLQSCLSLVPQPPKKDFIKMLENDGRVLRFEAVLDSARPEDRGRRFILSYRLSDDMITIHEPPVRNSGVIGGKFLERTRVAKPSSNPDQPDFYGPADFHIGAIIQVFSFRFRITDADEFVLKYMEENSSQFPEHTIESLRQKLGAGSSSTNEIKKGGPIAVARTYEPGEMEELVKEVVAQLKKLAITSSNRKDSMFLGFDNDRQGYISKENLTEMCNKMHLPSDPDLIGAMMKEMGAAEQDRISFEEFRKFFETS